MRYLVTGGTGLIGSNVCRLLAEAGDDVRALVRPGSEYEPLVELGVEPFEGDVQSLDDLVKGADGCDAVIHSAAVLGGAVQRMDEQRTTNVAGSFHAYDAARTHGIRCVALSSTPFLDHRQPLTEEARPADRWSEDPYTQTKGAAFVEAKRRVAEEGDDIVIVIPGGTYGPGVVLSRAMAAHSYNRVLRGALNGKIADYVTFPIPWVHAEDVATACVAAARRGVSGRTYLAFGAEDARSTAAWLNVALEVAGDDRRITEVRVDATDAGAVERYGQTLVDLATREFPVPWFDNTVTRQELGYDPRPLRPALEDTVAWLRANDQVT